MTRKKMSRQQAAVVAPPSFASLRSQSTKQSTLDSPSFGDSSGGDLETPPPQLSARSVADLASPPTSLSGASLLLVPELAASTIAAFGNTVDCSLPPSPTHPTAAAGANVRKVSNAENIAASLELPAAANRRRSRSLCSQQLRADCQVNNFSIWSRATQRLLRSQFVGDISMAAAFFLINLSCSLQNLCLPILPSALIALITLITRAFTCFAPKIVAKRAEARARVHFNASKWLRRSIRK